MGLFLPLFATLFASALKRNQSTGIPGLPDVTSPQITQALAASQQTLARRQGRKSTLITGGILGNPSLIRQGLR